MTPYAFGQKIAEVKPGIQPLAQPIPKPPKLPHLPAKNWLGREDSFLAENVTKAEIPSIEGSVKSLTGVALPFIDATRGRGFVPLANNAAVVVEGTRRRMADMFKNSAPPSLTAQSFAGAPAHGPVAPAAAQTLPASQLKNIALPNMQNSFLGMAPLPRRSSHAISR